MHRFEKYQYPNVRFCEKARSDENDLDVLALSSSSDNKGKSGPDLG